MKKKKKCVQNKNRFQLDSRGPILRRRYLYVAIIPKSEFHHNNSQSNNGIYEAHAAIKKSRFY